MSGLLGGRERSILVSVLVLVSFLAPLLFSPGALAITWDPIEEISEDKRIEYQRYPAIAAEAGKAYAIWADNGDKDYDIFLREHDGAAWQLEEELNTDDMSVDQWFPDIAVEGSTVHTVWQDPINGDWDIMYRSRFGGVLGPVTEISVDLGIEIQQYPRVAVSGGSIHVVWQDGRDGDWDVYYRVHDGVSWSPVQELSADVGTEAQTYPCIAAGGGRVYVVWVDAGGGDTDIVMKVFSGVSWGAITEVSQDSTNEAQDEPDISYDSGKLHVVWQEVQGTDKDIFHRSWDGSTFSSITEISIDSGTEFQDVPSVAAEFGKIHTVWADRGDGDWDIVYRQFDGTSWTAIQEISGDIASENQWNPYVASDNGVVHAVWEDQGDGDQDIFYRRGFEAPPVDNTPPDVLNVLLDGLPAQTYPISSLPATISLTATVDDSARGNSIIGGANFTVGPQNWPTSTMMVPDDFLDSSTEGFHFDVVPPVAEGTWQYCVYGWDVVPNYNTNGACATLIVNSPGAIDNTPPEISNVLIDGSPSQTFLLSSLPPSFVLTAVVDDSLTGASVIDSANHTLGPDNWPGTPMNPTDGSWDEIIEDADATLSTPSQPGSHIYCVYGSDQEGNHNTTGECATLDIMGDLPPAVTDVMIDGLAAKSILVGTASVTLTARVDDSFTGGSIIGGANFTSPSSSWGNSTLMTPSNPPLDSANEMFEVTIDTSTFPEGTYEFWVYGWDAGGDFNITPSFHAVLYVVPAVLVDHPPNIDIVAIQPPEVEQGETVSVIIGVSDDGSVVEVRVEVIGPDGLAVDNISVDYDSAHGGYVAELSYDQHGVYDITVWARDDGGNWASTDGSFEVLESAPAVQINYKPALALMFTILLLLVGFLVLWKIGEDNMIKKLWFLPFAIAEAITGTASAALGVLSIPPVASSGLAVDLIILLMGLSVPLLTVIRKLFLTTETTEEDPTRMEEDINPENAK